MSEKKTVTIIIALLVLVLVLAGIMIILPSPLQRLPQAQSETETVPGTTESLPFVSATETAAPETDTEPEPETEALPPETGFDAGIDGVIATVSDTVATPDCPEVTATVTYTNVNPEGAPHDGRVCKVTVFENGEAVETVDDFLLYEGASFGITRSYAFERYSVAENTSMWVKLEYNGDHIYTNVNIGYRNYSDEYYSMQVWDPFPYSIQIDSYHEVVIVWGKDEEGDYTKLAKVFVCSTGIATPQNASCNLLRKYEWKELNHNLWGQYSTWVTGNLLIHSVPYFSANKDDLYSWQYNRLGAAVSSGCIRMRVSDCKWIYDYCPCGTPVKFTAYRDLPEGVEKPSYEKIDLDSPYKGWDPTDPDPENPWHPVLPDMSWTASIPRYDETIEANHLYIKDYRKYAAAREAEEETAPAETGPSETEAP